VVFAGIVAFEQLFHIPSWYFDMQPHAGAPSNTTNKLALFRAEILRRVNTTDIQWC